MRFIQFKIKYPPEMIELFHNGIKNNLKSHTIVDLVTLSLSPIIKQNINLKDKIIQELMNRRISSQQISFAKFEKILRHINEDRDYGKELWPAFEEYIKGIVSEHIISDHLLVRIMSWLAKIKQRSQHCEFHFSKKIKEKDRFPYYHSRELTNLIILVCNYEPLKTNEMIQYMDDRLFNFSQYCDYFEIAISLYYMLRINRIGFETQELLLKRLLDKEITLAYSHDFSAACYSAVMANHLEFCKKSLTFVRIILSFKEFNEADIKIGDIFKNTDAIFSLSIVCAIRFC